MKCLYHPDQRLTKIIFRSTLLLAMIHWLGFQNLAFAGSSASATANATATVLPSITIVKTRDLAFGNGAPGDAAKVVAASDPANSASFNVGGAANAAYNITLPAGSINLVSGANTIAVGTFTSSPATSGTLSAAGAQTITVGATRAALPAAQAIGNYTGTFTVTVTYQ